MKSILHHPAAILAALGLVSGTLGSFDLGTNYAEAPDLGVYMVLAGVWFGLVIGYGVWRWGNRSLAAAAVAFAGTWIAWEAGGQPRPTTRPELARGQRRPRWPQELCDGICGRHRCAGDLGWRGRVHAGYCGRPRPSGLSSRRARCSACCCRRRASTTTRLSAGPAGRPPWRQRSASAGAAPGAASAFPAPAPEPTPADGCDPPGRVLRDRHEPDEEASRASSSPGAAPT